MNAPALDSKIDAVTVFARGARVSRVAELRPQGGALPSTVRFTGLPLAADDGSFRVRVEPVDGPEGAPGLPVARDLKIALDVPETVAEGKPEDEAALDEIRLEEKRLETRLAETGADLKRLLGLPFAPRPAGKEGEPPPPSPTAARLELLQFRSERSDELGQERRELQAKVREVAERRKEIEDRVRRASNDQAVQPHTLRKTVVVQIGTEGGDPTPARIVLEYAVPGARWAPAYAVHLGANGANATVNVRALVAQRTGEDWTGVRLTLSTARPDRWSELPDLPSLRIGRWQPSPTPVGWRPPPVGAEELFRDWDRAFGDRFRGREDDPLAAIEAPPPGAVEPTPALEELVENDTAVFDMGATIEDLDAGAAVDMEDTVMGAALEPPPPAAAAAPMAATSMPASPVPTDMARSLGKARRRASQGPRRRDDGPLRARDEMLDYGALRMPSPRSAERGHLVVTDRLHLYLELFVEREVQINFDVDRALSRAIDRAAGAGPHLPARHHLAASDHGFDYAYAAETPADIPSDRHYHSIPLLTREASSSLRHVAVPRESTDVFRVARFENPLPGPLLPGPADVFLGDEFVVTADVPATPAGAALDLGLGVDQGVKVARNTRFREETKGLTRGSLALDHEIDIGVQSHAPHPIRLEVRERIPVTGKDEKEVAVEVKAVSPEWGSWDPGPESGGPSLEGGHRWMVDLGPGEKKELRVAYRVRLSARHELVGGNRREQS